MKHVRKRKRKKPLVRPNHWVCGDCPEWDDVNGCWANYYNWLECPWDPDREYADQDDFDEMDFCPECGRRSAFGDLCPACEEANGGVE
jgi:hypothetical protein